MQTVFIDVREPAEFASGHVEGAINLPPQKLMMGEPAELKDLPRDTPLVVYCLSGARSNASTPFLKRFGFTNIVNGINQQHVIQKYF
jgi:phage shock protein E